MPYAPRILCVAAALIPVLAFPLATWAQEGVKGKIGAWEMRCKALADSSKEACGITQTVQSEDDRNVGIAVVIIKPAEAKTAIMRVIAPAGVFLVNGVTLKVDQTDIGRASFFRCAPERCHADVPLNDKLLEQLEQGRIATFVIYMEPEQGLRHQVLLEGLKEAVKRLH